MDKHTHPRVRGGSVFAADFRPLDRNDIARILYCAEALDRRTHQPGQHGGVIGRTGLAVLRALAVRFLNKRTGQLDPSLATIAKAANLARSTVQEAIKRLEAAGIIEKVRRMARERVRVWHEQAGRFLMMDRVLQITNAYRLNIALSDRATYGDHGTPLLRPVSSDTGSRSGTIQPLKSTGENLADMPPGPLRSALERLERKFATAGQAA
jgi:DNA-binding MarR family transcriptional regulator